jgi:hypothetical protein
MVVPLGVMASLLRKVVGKMYVIYVASLSDKKDDLTVQRKMV